MLLLIILIVIINVIYGYNTHSNTQSNQYHHSLRMLYNNDYSINNINKNKNNRVMTLRGGSLSLLNKETPAIIKTLSSSLSSLSSTSNSLFNSLFVLLSSTAVIWKLIESNKNKSNNDNKPAGVKNLQWRFLIVFWLMRMADWLQGPYFYEVYSSKIINGALVTPDLVSKLFLVGFASTGLFGAYLGRLVDTVGRKAGTLAYAALYTLGALSTRATTLPLLLLGRFAGGLGTSLLFSAPEAWLVGEYQKEGFQGNWLGQTFGWAYAGDSIVAITAGQLASVTAAKKGPTGPFTISVLFLALGSLLASLLWKENVAIVDNNDSTKKPNIGDAWKVMLADKKIMLVGAVQALFEGAMYIFVLQWPPALKSSIFASKFGPNASVPFGKVFSCFMACCLLGSSAFGAIVSRGIAVETMTTIMLGLATVAMTLATITGTNGLGLLIAAFFLFEACVGMYFPSIGTLRSKYIPDSHRSVIMNLFGIPLNLIVVSVFLSSRYLGIQGALTCASVALGLATASSIALGLATSNTSNKK